MTVEFLIVGQGISGSWLSYYLEQQGKSFQVIDNREPNSASRVSAGIINPVTGRRHVEVWMVDTLLPFAFDAYRQMESRFEKKFIEEKNLIDFFPTPQMRLSFMQRVEEGNRYLREYTDSSKLSEYFHFDFGCGEIAPVAVVGLTALVECWRSHLKNSGLLIEEKFDMADLHYNDNGISWQQIHASKIVFCDGSFAASGPLFAALPFAPNKGEALVLEIPDLPSGSIYKRSFSLVPTGTINQWWAGSTYEWKFADPYPTTVFKEKTIAQLNNWLRCPYRVVDHIAGVRPATLERRPFVGWHPLHPAVGILNGMGTKGCSLAPYFAKQLVDSYYENARISPEADVERFKKILLRTS